MAVAYYNSPIGILKISATDTAVTSISFEQETGSDTPNAYTTACIAQLKEYFNGTRQTFTIPTAPSGTPFQVKVWQALSTIPYGETRSYQDIAIQCGNRKASRAIGMANNRNPIPILIPCHRVIGKSGKLVGYAGGLPIKEYLLELEKKEKASSPVTESML